MITKKTLKLTREDAINDLPNSVNDQKNISVKSNKELAELWMRFGSHTSTWEWDDVEVIDGVET